MAIGVRGIYVGNEGGTAKRVTKLYVGVANVARKIVKAYVSPAGTARLAYIRQKTLTYRGFETNLTVARQGLSDTIIGDYCIMCGGFGTDALAKSTVDAYSSSLVRSTPTALSAIRNDVICTHVPGILPATYGLCFGGNDAISAVSSVVDAYNPALTRSTPTALSVARTSIGAGTTSSYALAMGGRNYASSTFYSTIDVYDSALTRTTPVSLSVARFNVQGTQGGFGGKCVAFNGASTTELGEIERFDDTLTNLGTAIGVNGRVSHAAFVVGRYAIGGGGRKLDNTLNYSTVDCFDDTWTAASPSGLSSARQQLNASQDTDIMVGGFACGLTGTTSATASVTLDFYNHLLTRSTISFGLARYSATFGRVGKFMLLGGGVNSSGVQTPGNEGINVLYV